MCVFYWVVKAVLWPFLRVIFRPWAEGTENVPREGRAILASNHLSFSDHFFGPLPVPRKVIFLAKSEYFTGRGLKGLISKAFFAGVGQIPVDRAGGAAGEQAIRTGLQVLAAGHVLGGQVGQGQQLQRGDIICSGRPCQHHRAARAMRQTQFFQMRANRRHPAIHRIHVLHLLRRPQPFRNRAEARPNWCEQRAGESRWVPAKPNGRARCPKYRGGHSCLSSQALPAYRARLGRLRPLRRRPRSPPTSFGALRPRPIR